MYKIKIKNRWKSYFKKKTIEKVYAEFEFQGKDMCEFAYSNLYCNKNNLPACSEIIIYNRKNKKVKSFFN